MRNRALILSGGAFRGYFQLPVIEHLQGKYKYDAIYGVSIGAINGAMAAQNDLIQLKELWENAQGFSDFFSNRYYFPFYGLYSMNPLRKYIEQHLSLDKMETEFCAGFTSFSDGKYRNLSTRDTYEDKQLWDFVQASSCIPGLMIPPKVFINGKQHIGCDGGYRNVIPIPRHAHENYYKHYDVVVCEPLQGEPLIEKNNSKFIFDLISITVEVFQYEIFKRDLDQLKKHKHTESITVYAPEQKLGNSFSLDKELMKFRYEQGIKAINDPIKLK